MEEGKRRRIRKEMKGVERSGKKVQNRDQRENWKKRKKGNQRKEKKNGGMDTREWEHDRVEECYQRQRCHLDLQRCECVNVHHLLHHYHHEKKKKMMMMRKMNSQNQMNRDDQRMMVIHHQGVRSVQVQPALQDQQCHLESR